MEPSSTTAHRQIKRKPVAAGAATLRPPGGPDPKHPVSISSSRPSTPSLDVKVQDLSITTTTTNYYHNNNYEDDHHDDDEKRPPLPPRVPSPLLLSPPLVTSPDSLSTADDASSSSFSPFPPPPLLPSRTPSPTPSTSAENNSSSSNAPRSPSFWQTALSETRYFAGGLVPHPTESTKHYTILRHSPPLIFYRGPTTSVTITIFSSSPSHPIPPDRTLWLQQRGYSGDTGMRLKALVGATTSWLDVTPATRVDDPAAASTPPATERAWKRDMARVRVRDHVPRETHVVRVPAAATDGYFRLVLCTGSSSTSSSASSFSFGFSSGSNSNSGETPPGKRKILCYSPPFRLASASRDASVVRGAKLRHLPLELGVKVASAFANNAVGNYIAPVTGAVQSKMQQYEPGFVGQTVAQVAYSASGVQGKVDGVGERWDRTREGEFEAFREGGGGDGTEEGVTTGDGGADAGEEEKGAAVVGPDEGPTKPFPLQFRGRVVPGSGQGRRMGVPTANLADVPDDVKFHLDGVYFGWACVIPGGKSSTTGGGGGGGVAGEDVSQDWHEAVITASVIPSARATVVAEKQVRVYMVHDFGGDDVSFVGAKLKVMVMGYLRPVTITTTTTSTSTSTSASTSASTTTKSTTSAAHDSTLEAASRDAVVAVASLARDTWGPEATLQRIRTAQSGRSLSDKYVDVRARVQQRVDRVPLHWAGVRTAGAELRDKALGNGGYWIPR